MSNSELNEQQLVKVVNDLVESQNLNHQIKQQELALERDKIQSQEKIALAALHAQQGDRVQQINLVSKLQSKKYITIWIITLTIFLIILVSIWKDKTEFALEVLKIGGALLAGYFAGLHKGRASILEKQHPENE